MKTRNLFLSLFAFAALCACNKEAQPETPAVLENDAYVAVNIVSPANTATRGTSDNTDDSYEAIGKDDENYVSKAAFLFFDGTNTLTSIKNVNFDNNDNFTNGTENPRTEVISSAVLVIEKETVMPEKMIVVINADVTGTIGTTKMSEIQEQTNNYSGKTSGSFVMSNSVYVDGGSNVIDYTVIPASSIKSTADAAKAAPVDVYVERVLAKVRASASVDASKQKSLELNDGSTLYYAPKYTGFTLANLADKSYLVKRLSKSYADWSWDAWNDLSNFRSYWANCPDDLAVSNVNGYNDISTDPIYCYENTKSMTELIVGATLYDTKNTTDEGDDTVLDIVKYLGDYWLFTDYANEGLKLLSATYPTLTVAHLTTATVSGGKAYEVKLVLNTDGETLIADSDKVTDINTTLAKMETAWHWKNGQTYFFTNVEHFGTDSGKNTHAVVRNHIYDINVTGIAGLGTPVVDPELPIDPEKPTDVEYYLAAKINILQWKVVSQEVSFN